MIHVYTQHEQGRKWLQRYRGCSAALVCVLGFTETALIPGISAAGNTPHARQYTAIADAEFLYYGPQPHPKYPLPPLHAGASPVLISRAIVEALALPIHLFNAGLPQALNVPAVDLGGTAAKCLSQGCALDLAVVKHLWEQGLSWGEQLATTCTQEYFIIGECVVGGTTTALALLTGLGIAAAGKVNSSHPVCNHAQKWALVQSGLQRAGLANLVSDPFTLVAAVGDPMQIAVAGMAFSLSQSKGVMLAGGTQMLAVYALMQSLSKIYDWAWQPQQIVVATTRWVAEDPTGNTVELAQLVGGVPLIATQLSFATSGYSQLRAYEQGYVKEGVAAGGCCVAASLTQDWNQTQFLEAIEALLARCE